MMISGTWRPNPYGSLDLHRKGFLTPKDEDGFFWILTEKGKNYIDKIDALQ